MTKLSDKKIKVSLLTINQYKRFESLKILFLIIQNQTYKNITEWVIVEGSQKNTDADQNKNNILNFIEEIKPLINYNIRYIEFSGKKLGGLRNLGNKSCIGDIIVCMDDDDYYPPERVEHAVVTLQNSNCLIAGVSDVYMYDIMLDKLFKFNGFMEYHSTNNCMAYKKEYLIGNSHDPEIEVGEERSFTSEFTKPLVKLQSEKCIIAISHSENTFNKRELAISCMLGILNTLKYIECDITKYIDKTIYEKMKKLYVKKEKSPYDIVYMFGGFSNSVDPTSSKLSDKDRNIINIANNFSKKNKKIAIYCEIEKNIKINNINYINWKEFPYHFDFNILFLVNLTGFMSTIQFNISTRLLCWDLYDIILKDQMFMKNWNLYSHKLNKIYIKSMYHKYQMYQTLENITELDDRKFYIIPSGLRIEQFSINKENIQRNPYRFCYTVQYERGLEIIILHIFSIIKKIEPRAELHIYGETSGNIDNELKTKIENLFSELGVCEHGMQSDEIIVREKYMSSFELYISNIPNEVDCVSIRESVVCGCIPLIANFGVFLDREGIKFDMNHLDKKLMQKNALLILQLMKDQNKLNSIRKDLKNKSTTLFSYKNISDQILNTL